MYVGMNVQMHVFVHLHVCIVYISTRVCADAHIW